MANLLPWLNDAVKNVQNTIGGVVNGAVHTGQDAVNNVAHAVAPQQQPQQRQVPQRPQFTQVQQRPLAAPRPAPAPTIPRPQVPHTNPINDFVNGVGGFVHDAANTVVNDAKPVLNTVGFLGTAPVAAITGDKNLQRVAADQLNHSIVPHDVATGKATPAQFAQEIAKTGVHYAPYAIGGGGKLVDTLGKTVANKVGTGVAGTIASKGAQIGANAAIAAPTFAGLNAVQQGLETGKFDPGQALQAGGQAALMAGGGQLAGDLLKGGAKGAIKGAKIAYNSPEDGFAKVPFNKDQRPLFKGNAPQAGKTPQLPQSYKYQNISDSGTTKYNELTPKNSFQDINGVAHPVQSNAKIAVHNTDGTGETKVFTVNNIGSQKFFNNQLVKYGQRGKIGSVTIDESPALVKQSNVPQANINDVAKALGTTPEKLSNTYRQLDNNQGAKVMKTQAEPQVAKQQASQPQLDQASQGKLQPLETQIKDLPKNRQGQIQKDKTIPSSSDTKYTTNTTKVNVDTVNPGDYQKVRSNAQRIESNVNVRARQAIHNINRLSTNEKANFWNVVEGTAKATTPKMTEAVGKWRELADHIHATSHALGGDTPHLGNYARHNWDLSDPVEAQRFTDLMNQKFNNTSGRTISPEDFKGLDNKPRAFDTLQQGQDQGFKLKNEGNPAQDIEEYVQSANSKLKTQAVAKGMQEAEAHIPDSEKSVSQHIGYKSNITTTQRGAHELRSLYESPQPKFSIGQKSVAKFDSFNRGTKATILSLSQFHTANIGMQSIPTLLAKGHPIRALDAAIDTARVTFSPKAADAMINDAIKDGTIDNAARIGTPILDGNDFNASGKLSLNAIRGEKLIFERQLPAMHIQMVKAVVDDLKKKGIPLDSPQARAAGNEIHLIMGYVNKTLNNMSSRNMRGASRVMLAPNFTRSKWTVLRDAFTKGGQAGHYARAAVIGKYAAEAALIAGIGAIAGQKSDDIKDTLYRALIHPSIPTPMKDDKGNNIELGLPSNYLSEALGLASTLNRGKDGRLGVSVDPSNIPQNLVNYGQGRLAAIPAMGLKVATNQNYAGKPLYDPSAPFASKVAQAGTTLATGVLPIGLQSLAYTKPVKDTLGKIPGVGGDIKNVLDAGTPGSNPLFKGALSALGLSSRTDKTVGNGLQTTQYFSALDNAKSGLNHQEQDAMDIYTGGKKNPVTGKYEVQPSYDDSRAKASVLLQNPKVIDHLISMNKELADKGQNVDPLWKKSKDEITSYLQYQAMPMGGEDRKHWVNTNKWYGDDFLKSRNDFFNSLPAGDPNKPKLDLQYPEATPNTQKAMDEYSNLTDSKLKGQFIDNHPEILDQWKKQSDYTNKYRQQLGYAPYKSAPEATPQLQSYMDKYSSGDKATRKAIRNSDPQQYQKMIAFYDSIDIHNINKAGALNQLQGEPDQTSAQNKAIKNLAQDIYQNPDGTYSIVPAGWMNGLGGKSGGKKGSKTAGNTAYKNAVKTSFKYKVPKVKTTYSTKGKTAKAFKAPSIKQYTVASNIKSPNVPLKKHSQVA